MDVGFWMLVNEDDAAALACGAVWLYWISSSALAIVALELAWPEIVRASVDLPRIS